MQALEPKLHVCIIDGDAAVRDSLATLITLNGHEVTTYATGREFLAAQGGRAQDGRPVDVVVCEAELPDISGAALYEVYKSQHPCTRFALLISRNDPTLTAAARRTGVDAVFHKPLVHRRLTSFVASQ